MKSIRSAHEYGNTVRMLKLPLILTDVKLYAAAIAQFYYLTKTLEQRLNAEDFKNNAMIQEILSLNLHHSSKGYEADLKQIYDAQNWKDSAEQSLTSATKSYCDIISNANNLQLIAISFILYGALVIGGGKSTQKKVKRIFPSYDHVLFDVSDDMIGMRRDFKACFNKIGSECNELERTKLLKECARFMKLNNTVVLSIRCRPYWCSGVVIGIGAFTALSVAVVCAKMYK